MSTLSSEVAATRVPLDAAPEPQGPETHIRPRKGWIAIDWSELWRYRELLYFLVWRDVKVRYKQAVLGIAWAVLAPVIQVAIFTLVFRSQGKIGDVPMSLYIFAAMIPWMFVSAAITQGGMSLVHQQHLLNKIYLPRLFIPSSAIGSAMVDLVISFAIFFVWMAVKGYVPSWQIVYVPALLLLTIFVSIGIASLLSALTVTYRDLRILIPFIAQIAMWVSFVPVNVDVAVNPKYQWILAFNPLFGVFDAYRSAMFGLPWRPLHLLSSVVGGTILLILGIFYFRKTERRFADIA
ncbi:MAG TPA: ABC transporter permease [Tepidisphaeraceae bacterium]